ncbi:MAG: hypothetical protein LBF74_13750 [Treponema sp.]|jgi:hypothetical protein|nr:hypothetical protein [Treponema sp.]
MNDIEPRVRRGYTPTNVLAKQGVTAIGSLIGGAGLLIAGVLPPVIGIILGGVVALTGIAATLSKHSDDRKIGILATAAGGLTILSKAGILKPLAGTLLAIGAVGLLAAGIWNGVKFLKGLKSRA